MIGSTLGHFRITAELGKGGMGEVYRAVDTSLGRDVAIKVLPEGFVADPDRLARFEREARLLASLSHPNIATIHEIGEEEGARFLVMEIAPGESLAQRIARGPIPVDAAVPIAAKIAAALEAAHVRGVIHRDLKPANVMVDDQGTVKVLDFGLGKVVEPAPRAQDSEGLTDSPTATFEATRAGVILGTAAYMSPEQANGKPADQRSDVWSFGCTFYEMLCGRPPFEGESAIDLLGAVLHEEPNFSALPRDTPTEVGRLLIRCLRRDRERRLQSIADARVILEEVIAGEVPVPEQLSGRPGAGRPAGRLITTVVVAAAAVAAIAAVLVSGIRSRPAPSPGPPEIVSSQLTEVRGVESRPTLAPDGSAVAFAGDEDGDFDIYIQRIDGRNAINLTPDSDADDDEPAYSPDGTKIAFRSERLDGGIFVMGATGESVRRVTDFGHHPSFSPDGGTLVLSTEKAVRPDQRQSRSEIRLVDLGSGESRRLHDDDAIQPTWSPHGERIAYWGLHPGSGQRDVWTIPADGGEPVPVTADPHLDWNPVWAPDGSFLYFLSDRGGAMNVWRVAIDEETGEVLGPPEDLTVPTRQADFLTVGRDGFVYSDLDRRGDLWRARLDHTRGDVLGPVEPVTRGSHDYGNVDVSPKGDLLAFVSWDVQQDILVARSDGTGLRRLTDDVHRDRSPRWSPDGTRLAFYSDRGGRYEVWSIHVDGSGLERHTDSTGATILYPLWSPSGDRMVITRQDASPFSIRPDIPWDEQQPETLPPLHNGAFQPFDWSPDGTRLVGEVRRPDGSQGGIVVYSTETGEYEELRATGSEPRWLPDSRRLVLLDPTGVVLLDTDTLDEKLLLPDPRDGRYEYLDLAADGGTLFLGIRTESADLWWAAFLP